MRPHEDRPAMPPTEDEPLLSSSSSTWSSISKSTQNVNSSNTDPESTPVDIATDSRSVEDATTPETSTLGRTVGWKSAYILVISRVIGSGIFATPGVIVKDVGSVGLALSLWFAGALIAACGLAVALEYGCMLPRSGGDKVYLEFVYRRPKFLASTLIAVNAVLLGFTASNCIVFAQYVLYAFDVDATDTARKSLAIGLLTAITIVHGTFVNVGIKIQNFLGWIKVALVAFMILSGLSVVATKPNYGDSQRSHFPHGADLWKDSDWSWGIISTSLFKVFYSFAGLNNVNNVMNEVRNPVRTLRSVTITALLTACFLYLLVNVAYFIVVPLEEIKESRELVAALFFERCFGPRVGKLLLPIAVALSGAGNVMVVTFALARLNQEIARQGFLPFADVLASSRPFDAPLGGLIVHYIPSLLVIAIPPSSDVYSFILEVEGYPAQFFTLALSVGLLWLRYKRADLKRPFKAWNTAVVLRILLSIALLAAPFFPSRHRKTTGGIWYASYAVVGISIIAFGVVYWLVWFRLLPRWRGYRIVERTQILDDNTSVTRLIHVPLTESGNA